MATSPNLTKTDPIASLGSILDMFHGKTNTSTDSGTTSTTRSNLTPEQLESIIGTAMAPAGMAQKSAGMYGSTGLSIARGQIAGDIAAKNAGTTTTTSGGTRTNLAAAPLQGTNPLAALALTQFGAPLLKKIGGKGGDWMDSLLGNSAAGSNVGPFATTGADLGDAIGEAGSIDAIGSAEDAAGLAGLDLDSILTDGATDAAIDGGSDFLGDLGDWLGFKNGGVVRGYASGGSVYKNPTAIQAPKVVIPTISPDGAVDPNPQTPRSTGSTPAPVVATAKIKTSTHVATPADVGGSGPGSQNASDPNGSMGPVGAKLGRSLVSAVATANPMAFGVTMAIQAAMAAYNHFNRPDPYAVAPTASPSDTENEQSVMDAINADVAAAAEITPVAVTPSATPSATVGRTSESARGNDASSGRGSGGDNGYGGTGAPGGTVGVGYGSVSSGPMGFGGAAGSGDGDGDGGGSDGGDGGGDGGGGGGGGDGGGHGMKTGGKVNGPGTSMSDSIPAMLSDGEYVIDAKTVSALGPDFFRAIQSQFNPSAVSAQRGRN